MADRRLMPLEKTLRLTTLVADDDAVFSPWNLARLGLNHACHLSALCFVSILMSVLSFKMR